MASWRYIFHPNQRQKYVPVARLTEEQIWRRVCVQLNNAEKPYMIKLKNFLCNAFLNQPGELDKADVSFSEVWLVQEKKFYQRRRRRWGSLDDLTSASLDYIGEGSCSQFGTMLLHVECLENERGNTGKYILSILRKTRLNTKNSVQGNGGF